METCCQESILTVCLHEQEAGHSPKPAARCQMTARFSSLFSRIKCLQMPPDASRCFQVTGVVLWNTDRPRALPGDLCSARDTIGVPISVLHQETLSEVEFKAFNRMSQDVMRERERAKSPFGLVQWLNSSILYVPNGQSQACQRWGSLLKATLNLSVASPQQQKVRDSRLQSKENQTQLRTALSITVTSQIRSTLEAHLQPEAATPGICLYVEPDKSKWIQMANSHVSSKLKARETSGLIGASLRRISADIPRASSWTWRIKSFSPTFLTIASEPSLIQSTLWVAWYQ